MLNVGYGVLLWRKEPSLTARPTTTRIGTPTYAINQESALRAFLDGGDIPIHNKLAEVMRVTART